MSITTYVACIQDVEEQILNNSSAFPFMSVFQAATGSTAAAIGMSVPFVVLAYSMTLNSVAAGKSGRASAMLRQSLTALPSLSPSLGLRS